jgi:hypothetical protein
LRFALWGWTVILLTMPCFHSMMQNNATKENPSNWFYVVASSETEIKFWNWNQVLKLKSTLKLTSIQNCKILGNSQRCHQCN